MERKLYIVILMVFSGFWLSGQTIDTIAVDKIFVKCQIQKEFDIRKPLIVDSNEAFENFLTFREEHFICRQDMSAIPLIDFEKESYIAVGTYAKGCFGTDEEEFVAVKNSGTLELAIDMFVDTACRPGELYPFYLILKVDATGIDTVNCYWTVDLMHKWIQKGNTRSH